MEENWKGGEQRWPIDDAGLRLGIADIDRTIPAGIAGISASRRSPRVEIIENKDAIAHVDCPIPIAVTADVFHSFTFVRNSTAVAIETEPRGDVATVKDAIGIAIEGGIRCDFDAVLNPIPIAVIAKLA